jgi:hypothetical protein
MKFVSPVKNVHPHHQQRALKYYENTGIACHVQQQRAKKPRKKRRGRLANPFGYEQGKGTRLTVFNQQMN